MGSFAPLVWDETGKKLFETGVSNVALYPQDTTGVYGTGVAWNGVTNISESPSGAEATTLWANNGKYLNLYSVEEYASSIEAYTYPDEFAECDGSAEIAKGVSIGQQTRKSFGLAYKTLIGSDTDGNDHGSNLHLVYGCKAAPSARSPAPVNDSPEALSFSWEISTTPVSVTGHKPTASVEIDSTKVDAEKLAAFEKILFGSDTAAARLPLPDEVASLFAAASSEGQATGEYCVIQTYFRDWAGV